MLNMDEMLEERLIAYAAGTLTLSDRASLESILREGSQSVVERLQVLLTSRVADADRGVASSNDRRINARLEEMVEEMERGRLLERAMSVSTQRGGAPGAFIGRSLIVLLVVAGLTATAMWFYVMQRRNPWEKLLSHPVAKPHVVRAVKTVATQNSKPVARVDVPATPPEPGAAAVAGK